MLWTPAAILAALALSYLLGYRRATSRAAAGRKAMLAQIEAAEERLAAAREETAALAAALRLTEARAQTLTVLCRRLRDRLADVAAYVRQNRDAIRRELLRTCQAVTCKGILWVKSWFRQWEAAQDRVSFSGEVAREMGPKTLRRSA